MQKVCLCRMTAHLFGSKEVVLLPCNAWGLFLHKRSRLECSNVFVCVDRKK